MAFGLAQFVLAVVALSDLPSVGHLTPVVPSSHILSSQHTTWVLICQRLWVSTRREWLLSVRETDEPAIVNPRKVVWEQGDEAAHVGSRCRREDK